MTHDCNLTASFARRFFKFLQERDVPSVILHGGDVGFEHELSDIDFAVDRASFLKLPTIISEYCDLTGWQLCQILRHETTAAYFVCSHAEDPARAVALDACSDYQRHGTVFLTADRLLEGRRSLAWGGHGLSPAAELAYRFVKAAAKTKNADACAAEFSSYPEDIRRSCAAWLDARWGLAPSSWDANGLQRAFAILRDKSNLRPSIFQAGAIGRIASRVLYPTGLIVIAGHECFESSAARLEGVFGSLYFRRFHKSRRWRPTLLKDLVASSLIVVPELASLWAKGIPANCIHRLDPSKDCSTQDKAIARHLQERCKHRHALPV